MIVLHVARARTDSINIRGSFGKTQAALWITGATFLYFSGCPYPFHSLSLLSFFSLSLSLSLFSTLFPPSPSRFFHDCPLPARHRPMLLSSTILLIFSPFHIRHCIFLSLPFSILISVSLSLFLFHFRSISTRVPGPLTEQAETRHFPARSCYPPD